MSTNLQTLLCVSSRLPAHFLTPFAKRCFQKHLNTDLDKGSTLLLLMVKKIKVDLCKLLKSNHEFNDFVVNSVYINKVLAGKHTPEPGSLESRLWANLRKVVEEFGEKTNVEIDDDEEEDIKPPQQLQNITKLLATQVETNVAIQGMLAKEADKNEKRDKENEKRDEVLRTLLASIKEWKQTVHPDPAPITPTVTAPISPLLGTNPDDPYAFPVNTPSEPVPTKKRNQSDANYDDEPLSKRVHQDRLVDEVIQFVNNDLGMD